MKKRTGISALKADAEKKFHLNVQHKLSFSFAGFLLPVINDEKKSGQTAPIVGLRKMVRRAAK